MVFNVHCYDLLFFNENLMTVIFRLLFDMYCKYCAPKKYMIKTMMEMVVQILQITVSCACNRDYSTIKQANTAIITQATQPLLQPNPVYWSRCKEEHTLTHNANLFTARGPFVLNQGLDLTWTRST